MNKKILLILFFIPSLVFSQLVSDAKMWAGISVSKKFNDFEFTASEELRMDENFSHIDKIFTEIGADYQIKKFLSVGINYRFDRDNDYESYGYDISHRIDIGATFKKKIGNWKLSYKIKYQTKTAPSYENNPTFLRNKLSADYDMDSDFTPFAAFEFYYQFNDENVINRQRFQLGSKYKINGDNSIKAFYMFERRFNTSNLKNNHIWGVSYSIEI